MQLDEIKYTSSQWYRCMLENQDVKTVSNTDSPFVAETLSRADPRNSQLWEELRGYLAGPANPKEIKESQQKDPPNAHCCFCFSMFQCTSSNFIKFFFNDVARSHVNSAPWMPVKCLLSLLRGMNVLPFYGSMRIHSSHESLLLAAHSRGMTQRLLIHRPGREKSRLVLHTWGTKAQFFTDPWSTWWNPCSIMMYHVAMNFQETSQWSSSCLL